VDNDGDCPDVMGSRKAKYRTAARYRYSIETRRVSMKRSQAQGVETGAGRWKRLESDGGTKANS